VADEFIILTITETCRTVRVQSRFDDPIEAWPPANENLRPGALMSLQLSDLAKDTFLSTPQARRIPLVRYESPAKDGLGAKFFFPRKDSRGNPSVDPAASEVRFEARIAGRKISATFSPVRMVRNGRFEM
jgi:hypothetical protein